MKLTGDKLDFAISQYVDGTLSEIDRRALEDQLFLDAEARLHVTEEARLTNLLRDAVTADLAPINFERFQSHISGLIEAEDAHVAEPIPMQRVWVRRLSIAAAVAVVAVLGLRFGTFPGSSPTEPVGTAFVAGPAVETSPETAEIKIAVGPSDALAKRGMTLSLADDSIFTPSPRVVISAGNNTGQASLDLNQPLY